MKLKKKLLIKKLDIIIKKIFILLNDKAINLI